MSRWWERFPSRLEDEIEALRQAGAVVRRLDMPAVPEMIGLDVRYPFEGRQLHLIIMFPDLYPYFRPEISAPETPLARHRNPFSGFLCFMGSSTHGWNYDMRAADLLREQLGDVLRSGDPNADLAAARAVEGIHPDPISAYFPYHGASFVAVDSDWQIPPDIQSGTLDVAYEIAGVSGGFPRLRGIVKCVRPMNVQTPVASWDGAIPASLSGTLKASWVRSDQPIVEPNPVRFLERLAALDGRLRQRTYISVGKHLLIELFAVLFLEEVEYRTLGPSWMFVLAVKKAQKRRPEIPIFVRALRGGRMDLGYRVPSVQTLRGRRIAVFGLGALGAPVALELARNGVGELRLVDPDLVEPGPTVRWPLGISAYGEAKPRALATFISENFPRTQVELYDDRIGSIRTDALARDPQDDRVARMLDGVDLVFDATVEIGAHHFLSDEARKARIPYVYAFGSPGVRGGLVARIRPDGPCWLCLQHALYEQKSIPEPPGDDDDVIRAAGCTEPTFSGTGFDLAEVGMEAVRTIVGTLAAGNNAYPSGQWDVAVLALRDAAGHRQLPAWQAHDIPQREACPCCSAVAIAG